MEEHEPLSEFEMLVQAFQKAEEQGDVAAIEAASQAMMHHAYAEMSKDSSPDLVLKLEAYQHEEQGQWAMGHGRGGLSGGTGTR